MIACVAMISPAQPINDSECWRAPTGQVDSKAGTITIDVKGRNHRPHADDDSAYVAENGTTTIDLAKDIRDRDGDPLTTRILSGPHHGSLTINADGTYTYTPDANWHGLDGFVFVANDDQYDSNRAMM